MILLWLGARKISRRSARDSNGASLSAGHQPLHLHPAKEAGGSSAPVPPAPARGSCPFGYYLRRTPLWCLADNGWQGQLRGLAIYNRELTAAEVLQHYDAWTRNQQAEIKNEGPAALYLCNEGAGNVVHSQTNSGNDLHIPERYFVLRAPFLELPWDEFQPSWSYCKNVLINIGGFVPLGFFFCAYFSSVRRLNRAALATILLGGVVSFAIEVLQAFLPTRDSGMTDIITNTLGTGIGAMLYNCETVQALFATLGVGGQRPPVCKR